MPRVLQTNVQRLAELERAALRERTLPECICDYIAAVASQFWFAIAHAVWFGAWIAVNSGRWARIEAFDPYPYAFLTLAVSLESIFLSLSILMSQSRGIREADERARLDLQINLLAERETTKLLQLVRALCAVHKLPEADDPELQELLRPTNPEKILDKIQSEQGAPVDQANTGPTDCGS